MNPKLEQKIRELVESMPKLIKDFKYRPDPSLFFYQKTISLSREKSLVELFDDETDRYIELIYATLASWNMNSRRAKMLYFNKFKSSILDNKKSFLELSAYESDNLSEKEFRNAKGL